MLGAGDTPKTVQVNSNSEPKVKSPLAVMLAVPKDAEEKTSDFKCRVLMQHLHTNENQFDQIEGDSSTFPQFSVQDYSKLKKDKKGFYVTKLKDGEYND